MVVCLLTPSLAISIDSLSGPALYMQDACISALRLLTGTASFSSLAFPLPRSDVGLFLYV